MSPMRLHAGVPKLHHGVTVRSLQNSHYAIHLGTAWHYWYNAVLALSRHLHIPDNGISSAKGELPCGRHAIFWCGEYSCLISGKPDKPRSPSDPKHSNGGRSLAATPPYIHPPSATEANSRAAGHSPAPFALCTWYLCHLPSATENRHKILLPTSCQYTDCCEQATRKREEEVIVQWSAQHNAPEL